MKARAYLRAACVTMEITVREQIRDSFVFFTIFMQPLVIAVLALWMLRGRGGEYAMFVVVGSGLTGLWSGVLFMSGNSITWERWEGTLEPLASVPTPLPVIVAGKVMANIALSFSAMVIGYTLGSLLLGYPMRVGQPGLFFISLILGIASFASLGLIMAPLFLLSPATQALQNGLEFPVYLLAGFLFPVALLPGWTSPFSYVLAPYWAARALHGTSTGGATSAETLLAWGAMLALMLIYGLLSIVLFRRVLVKIRQDATIGLQ